MGPYKFGMRRKIVKDKTRILIYMPNLSGGGAEKVVVNIIKLIDKNCYDIHLVLAQETGEYLNLIPKYVHLHSLSSRKVMFSIFKLYKKIDEIKPDIIFTSLIRTSIALYLALFFLPGKKIKVIHRSPNSPKLLLKNKQLSFFMRYLLQKAYQHASLIIAQTPEMKSEINQYYNVSLDKIKVYLNPIDKEQIDKSLQNTRNPFNEKNINIVAAGRLTYQKGFDTLILSFKKVTEYNEKFKLYIIGQGSLNEINKLKESISNNKLEKNVFLLGFQANPYVYFKFANLYVLSSRWEGLPNTILENLYLNKPIVATKCIPFMDELIHNKKNGLLVNIDDKEALTNAILQYQSIDTNYKTLSFDDSITDVFKNV